MSPPSTKKMGDLNDLPACAPEGLKALFVTAEGVIQKQIKLLGSGTPSQAPDMWQLLHNEGISDPDGQATMLDRYGEHKDDVNRVKSDFERQDTGITVRTGGIGKAVTDAYDAVDTSVGELNDKIDAAHRSVYTVTDENGNPVRDAQGNPQQALPSSVVNGLFTALWDTVNTTYEQVSGVSDRAAAEALGIELDDPTHPRSISPAATGPLLPSVAPNSPASSAANDGVEYTAAATDADYAAYTGSKDVKAAIDGALDALGIHDPEARENWTRGYLVLIERESGGDPNAINNWDSNAASGQHSRGLCQTIPATFESYHVAGTSNNIYDPVANVAASMNYVMERYDVAKDGSNLQSAVQQTNPAASPKGY
ncbi:transglycosylase SLT domain-containing protein [Nocardia carnea]|uniref:transglycosylase SLT domain-containing protein n=1 Tax=Nocardia carnea TaxID=37328 RepID=UPI0024563593|nr:transglycosylase SLT domain-containing protein [Nocardia carnea]